MVRLTRHEDIPDEALSISLDGDTIALRTKLNGIYLSVTSWPEVDRIVKELIRSSRSSTSTSKRMGS